MRRARTPLAARARALHYRQTLLPLAARVVSESQREYNAMVIGVFQLLQAKRDEIETGRRYVEALTDYWVARTELERAVGGELAFATAPLPAPLPIVPKASDARSTTTEAETMVTRRDAAHLAVGCGGGAAQGARAAELATPPAAGVLCPTVSSAEPGRDYVPWSSSTVRPRPGGRRRRRSVISSPRPSRTRSRLGS